MAEVESVGGVVRHRFSDRAFVAQIPKDVRVDALAKASTEMPEDLDETDRLVIGAWRSLGSKFDESKVMLDENRKLDAPGYQPPKYNR